MKKLTSSFIVLTMLIMGFSSCSSDDDTTPPEDKELRDVVVDVEYFTSETEVNSKSSKDNPVTNLTCWVFDETARMLFERKDFEGASLSSQIKLKLPDGSYTITLMASDRPLVDFGKYDDDRPSEKAIADLTLPEYRCVRYSPDATSDLFQATDQFVVKPGLVNKKMVLKRKIGRVKMTFNDLDKAPAKIEKLIPVLYDGYDKIEIGGPVEFFQYYGFSLPYGVYLNGRPYYKRWSVYAPNAIENDLNKKYAGLIIDKSEFKSYGPGKPIMMNLPQTNYLYETEKYTYYKNVDLVLIGLAKAEGTENDQEVKGLSLTPRSNSRIVFHKVLKRNIHIKANESLNISGNIFDSVESETGIKVTVSDAWGETVNVDY